MSFLFGLLVGLIMGCSGTLGTFAFLAAKSVQQQRLYDEPDTREHTTD